MKRRDFLKAAGGGAAASAAVGTAEATTTTGDRTTTGEDGSTTGGNTSTTSGGGSLPGAGTTKTVAVGPNGEYVFDPETVYVQPGTTVKWVWESDFHNIVVESQPDAASWSGTPGSGTYDTGYEYSFQFTETGSYEYYCSPHRGQGMVGSVVVNESGQAPGGGGGGEEEVLNPEEMGVPFQAHYVGLATIVGIIVAIVYNFFVLKYGESDNASAPNKE